MIRITTFALAATALTATFMASHSAEARGSRQYFVQNYTLDKPLHGFSGRGTGGYVCDYQRHPNRVCTINSQGREKCVIKNWTLRQHCY